MLIELERTVADEARRIVIQRDALTTCVGHLARRTHRVDVFRVAGDTGKSQFDSI